MKRTECSREFPAWLLVSILLALNFQSNDRCFDHILTWANPTRPARTVGHFVFVPSLAGARSNSLSLWTYYFGGRWYLVVIDEQPQLFRRLHRRNMHWINRRLVLRPNDLFLTGLLLLLLVSVGIMLFLTFNIRRLRPTGTKKYLLRVSTTKNTETLTNSKMQREDRRWKGYDSWLLTRAYSLGYLSFESIAHFQSFSAYELRVWHPLFLNA